MPSRTPRRNIKRLALVHISGARPGRRTVQTHAHDDAMRRPASVDSTPSTASSAAAAAGNKVAEQPRSDIGPQAGVPAVVTAAGGRVEDCDDER